jgi:hypothetical protein
MAYEEMDTVPAYEAPIWEEGRVMNPDVLKWSRTEPPPAIGTEIIVGNDNLSATVIAYFTEGNWLGLLARLTDPPDKKRDPNVHVFGPEYRMK